MKGIFMQRNQSDGNQALIAPSSKKIINSTTEFPESTAAAELLKARLTLEEQGILEPNKGTLTQKALQKPITQETLNKIGPVTLEVHPGVQLTGGEASTAVQAQRLSEGNIGYNVSPKEWYFQFQTIGKNYTYLTNYETIAKVIGFKTPNTFYQATTHATPITISHRQMRGLEHALGLEPHSLGTEIRLTQVSDIQSRELGCPLVGNQYFKGPGKGLPEGGPEVVIKAVSTKEILTSHDEKNHSAAAKHRPKKINMSNALIYGSAFMHGLDIGQRIQNILSKKTHDIPISAELSREIGLDALKIITKMPIFLLDATGVPIGTMTLTIMHALGLEPFPKIIDDPVVNNKIMKELQELGQGITKNLPKKPWTEQSAQIAMKEWRKPAEKIVNKHIKEYNDQQKEKNAKVEKQVYEKLVQQVKIPPLPKGFKAQQEWAQKIRTNAETVLENEISLIKTGARTNEATTPTNPMAKREKTSIVIDVPKITDKNSPQATFMQFDSLTVQPVKINLLNPTNSQEAVRAKKALNSADVAATTPATIPSIKVPTLAEIKPVIKYNEFAPLPPRLFPETNPTPTGYSHTTEYGPGINIPLNNKVDLSASGSHNGFAIAISIKFGNAANAAFNGMQFATSVVASAGTALVAAALKKGMDYLNKKDHERMEKEDREKFKKMLGDSQKDHHKGVEVLQDVEASKENGSLYTREGLKKLTGYINYFDGRADKADHRMHKANFTLDGYDFAPGDTCEVRLARCGRLAEYACQQPFIDQGTWCRKNKDKLTELWNQAEKTVILKEQLSEYAKPEITSSFLHDKLAAVQQKIDAGDQSLLLESEKYSLINIILEKAGIKTADYTKPEAISKIKEELSKIEKITKGDSVIKEALNAVEKRENALIATAQIKHLLQNDKIEAAYEIAVNTAKKDSDFTNTSIYVDVTLSQYMNLINQAKLQEANKIAAEYLDSIKNEKGRQADPRVKCIETLNEFVKTTEKANLKNAKPFDGTPILFIEKYVRPIAEEIKAGNKDPFLKLQLDGLIHIIIANLNIKNLESEESHPFETVIQPIIWMSQMAPDNLPLGEMAHSMWVMYELGCKKNQCAYNTAFEYAEKNPHFVTSNAFVFANNAYMMELINQFEFEKAKEVVGRYHEAIKQAKTQSEKDKVVIEQTETQPNDSSKQIQSGDETDISKIKEKLSTKEYVLNLQLQYEDIHIRNATSFYVNLLDRFYKVVWPDNKEFSLLKTPIEIHKLSEHIIPTLIQLVRKYPYVDNEHQLLWKKFIGNYEGLNMQKGVLSFANSASEVIAGLSKSQIVPSLLKWKYPEKKETIQQLFERAAVVAQTTQQASSAALAVDTLRRNGISELSYETVAPIATLSSAGLFGAFETWYKSRYGGQIPESSIYYMLKDNAVELATMLSFLYAAPEFSKSSIQTKLSTLNLQLLTFNKVTLGALDVGIGEYSSKGYGALLHNLMLLQKNGKFDELEKRLKEMPFINAKFDESDEVAINKIKIFNYQYTINKLYKENKLTDFLENTNIVIINDKSYIGKALIPLERLSGIDIMTMRLSCITKIDNYAEKFSLANQTIGNEFLKNSFKDEKSSSTPEMSNLLLKLKTIDAQLNDDKLNQQSLFDTIPWIKNTIYPSDSLVVKLIKIYYFNRQLKQLDLDPQSFGLTDATELSENDGQCVVKAFGKYLPLSYFENSSAIIAARMKFHALGMISDAQWEKELELIQHFPLQRLQTILPDYKWSHESKMDHSSFAASISDRFSFASYENNVKHLNTAFTILQKLNPEITMPKAVLITKTLLHLTQVTDENLRELTLQKDMLASALQALKKYDCGETLLANPEQTLAIIQDLDHFDALLNSDHPIALEQMKPQSEFGIAIKNCLDELHHSSWFFTLMNNENARVLIKNMHYAPTFLEAFKYLNGFYSRYLTQEICDVMFKNPLHIMDLAKTYSQISCDCYLDNKIMIQFLSEFAPFAWRISQALGTIASLGLKETGDMRQQDKYLAHSLRKIVSYNGNKANLTEALEALSKKCVLDSVSLDMLLKNEADPRKVAEGILADEKPSVAQNPYSLMYKSEITRLQHEREEQEHSQILEGPIMYY